MSRLSAQNVPDIGKKAKPDTTEVASKNKSAPVRLPKRANGNFGDDDQNNPSTGGDSTGTFGDAEQSNPTTDGNSNAGFSDSDMGSIPVENELNGDLNGDGDITPADVRVLVDIILGKQPAPATVGGKSPADINGDGDVTIADVTKLVNIISEKE